MGFQVPPAPKTGFCKQIAFNSTEARHGVTNEKSCVRIIKFTSAKRELILAVFTAKFCRMITKHSGLTDADPV